MVVQTLSHNNSTLWRHDTAGLFLRLLASSWGVFLQSIIHVLYVVKQKARCSRPYIVILVDPDCYKFLRSSITTSTYLPLTV